MELFKSRWGMVADDCNVGPRGGGTEKDTPAVMALRKPQTGEKTL